MGGSLEAMGVNNIRWIGRILLQAAVVGARGYGLGILREARRAGIVEARSENISVGASIPGVGVEVNV